MPYFLYIIFFTWVICAFLYLYQDGFVKDVYREEYDIWIDMGAPGGWFWRPPGRGWIDNFILTRSFWYRNQFDFPMAEELPLAIYKKYKRCRFITLFLFLLGFIAMLVVLGVHAYNLGQSR